MKGITVTLYERMQSGTDAFNRPEYTEIPVEISNVLVAPATEAGQELLDVLNLTGRKAVYTLAIPKGDTHSWEGCRVDFFGERWRVIGLPTEGIEDLIPLAWNRKVQVERIE
jgi:hypothetical protein